ncbi:protein phosphatase 2C domain-containing protein [Actinoplanes sp. NPDC051411]|uniref:protein phosphatase 2C domain-containing protein n=1 Tax=Actinoplanes sp. NPDC051411 TaxID=3155522 RepID=UPI00342730DB
MASIPAYAGHPNEDFGCVTPTGAVLLDGAGLSGTTTRCKHGVDWFARTLGGSIASKLAATEQGLRAVLSDAILETANLHRHTCDLNDPGTPSATVIVVRIVEEMIQYLVLADSVLTIELSMGDPLVVTDDREALVGRHLRQQMDQLSNGTTEHDAARREYVQALRAHRNRHGGFWVAAADPDVAEEALVGELPLRNARSVTLLSDGASRLVDRFHQADWPELVEMLRQDGPEELLKRVRTLEEADPEGRRWPRGKANDDATALFLEL